MTVAAVYFICLLEFNNLATSKEVISGRVSIFRLAAYYHSGNIVMACITNQLCTPFGKKGKNILEKTEWYRREALGEFRHIHLWNI